jgi:RNA-binding protein YhbY
MSHEIAREIEDQLEYPGQVKVTVIRESRAVDVARNHAAVQNGDGTSLESLLDEDATQPEHPPIQAA